MRTTTSQLKKVHHQLFIPLQKATFQFPLPMKGKFMNKPRFFISSTTALKQGSDIVFHINPSSQNIFPNNTHFPESANQARDEQILPDFHVCDKEIFGISIDSKIVPPMPEIPISSESATISVLPLQVMKEPHPPHDQVLMIMECPPGGRDGVVLYTTSMRGIRKTFEDCEKIRFLLESFRVFYQERDVSMDLEFREELWRIMGRRIFPPRLFVRGRYVGGAEEVMVLHEQGRLTKLLHGMPLAKSRSCHGCGGARFVVCPKCSGSRKCVESEQTEGLLFVRCLDCNENGLVKCPVCC